MTALNQLPIHKLIELRQRQGWSAEALVRACLERISSRDELIRAWVHTDPDAALQEARRYDRLPARGVLHGIPIGIKDVIDTADMPTRYGSPIYQQHVPAADAYCVTALRCAGAIILGKNATAEFAHTLPPETRNPHNPAHTPGGSSSGSAAAVADYMVPASIATQTGGSTIRPAAYCGIVGFKPTFGWINRAGIKPVAESLDTTGIMARSVEDIVLLLHVLTHSPATLPAIQDSPVIGLCRTPHWDELNPESRDRLEAVARDLESRGARIHDVRLPAELETTYDDQRLVMNYEAARALMYERKRHPDQISSALARQLDTGDNYDKSSYDNALDRRTQARQSFIQFMQGCDVILTPSAPGPAPRGLKQSGTSLMNRNWTLLGTPCITLPAGTSTEGLPIGVQLVGRPNDDMHLLAWAQWAQSALA